MGAAQCFIDYQKEYPNAEKAPAAIFNAGLNFFKAKEVEKALGMQERLYEQYNEHELAPKALYSIAEIFRETAVYEQSAYYYEVFVQNYPNHPLAEKALRFASLSQPKGSSSSRGAKTPVALITGPRCVV